MHKVSALGIVYSKLNVVYVCNETTDLKRNGVINLKETPFKKRCFFVFKKVKSKSGGKMYQLV